MNCVRTLRQSNMIKKNLDKKIARNVKIHVYKHAINVNSGLMERKNESDRQWPAHFEDEQKKSIGFAELGAFRLFSAGNGFR